MINNVSGAGKCDGKSAVRKSMTNQQAHHAFIAIAIVIAAAVIASVLVYAYILSTFYGGNVEVSSVHGTVLYCTSNSTTPSDWTSNLSIVSGSAWYAEFQTTSSGYSGAVTLTWTLQMENDGTETWTDQGATQSTSVNMTGSTGQTVYASPLGSQTSNKNWNASTTTGGNYRIKVVVTSP